ncbi:DNA-binding transcriptional regulator, LysR family [Bhargavaea ginsengi]|uniref:DNA-binding transcriptional regulator, LysR family n=1 Tax=Bhargavaea ginsengi TaxID=426757 RepID=A0A1H6UBK8_9BACL|nr:LysR family transcriptional regulator [Bhargavaea ginsengi]SEI89738.1 DNA-binding transcriptional regulator, LysR family [Bhargavaea ginsengi]
MDIKNFSTRDLNIFREVAEQRSFTKAGERLFIAQPSISKTIQRLELELGLVLFNRNKKQLSLTDAGEIVYQYSKSQLTVIQQMQLKLNELSEIMVGTISIGLPQIIGTFLFPSVWRVFSERYPGVTIQIEEKGGLVTERLVEKENLDVAFVVLPVQNPNLNIMRIYEDQFVVCVPSTHPLSNREVISLIELENEKFILFEKSFALHRHVVNACKETGFVPQVAMESTQWDLVLELVSAGMGISVVPRVLANKLNNIDISTIPLHEPDLKWQIGMITNEKAYQSFALKAFVQVVEEVYAPSFRKHSLQPGNHSLL